MLFLHVCVRMDIVIAREKEPVHSLLEYIDSPTTRVFVYNQGRDQLLFSDDRVRTINGVAPMGKEARAYLLHIVENYNNLGELVVFLRGNPFAHMNRTWHGKTFSGMVNGSEEGPVQPRMMLDEANAPRHQARVDVHGASRMVLGTAMTSYRFSAGAQYAVTRKRLLERPLGWWKRMLQLVIDDDVNAWEMERLWMYVFGLLDVVPALQAPTKKIRKPTSLSDMPSFLKFLSRNMSHFELDPTRKIDSIVAMDQKHRHAIKVFDMITPTLMIEIGSWRGKSSIAFAKRMKPGSHLLCIDTWLGDSTCWTTAITDRAKGGAALQHAYGYPTLYYTFLSNVFAQDVQNIIVPFPTTSMQAHATLEYYGCVADAIYVDGSQCKGDVYRDMSAYWSLLRPGGVMFGPNYSSAMLEVDRFVEENAASISQDAKMDLQGDVWFIRKASAE